MDRETLVQKTMRFTIEMELNVSPKDEKENFEWIPEAINFELESTEKIINFKVEEIENG